jgi:hypothetical protein
VEPPSPRVDARAFASVPEQVVVAGQHLQVSARLWRDFQPSGRTAGKPLTATLWIEAVEAGSFPDAWDAAHAWFVQGDAVWAADLVDQPAPASDRTRLRMIRSARGGPDWEPGTTVDVIVELRDAAGATLRLARRGETILRVD